DTFPRARAIIAVPYGIVFTDLVSGVKILHLTVNGAQVFL
ncbi:13492_t:CDS:1, partial [Entrophospora sp. SA101]